MIDHGEECEPGQCDRDELSENWMQHGERLSVRKNKQEGRTAKRSIIVAQKTDLHNHNVFDSLSRTTTLDGRTVGAVGLKY